MKKLILLLLLAPFVANAFSRGKVMDAALYDLATGTELNGVITNTIAVTDPLQIITYQHVSIHAVYSGSGITGRCTMQVSNDKKNWVDVSLTTIEWTDGGAPGGDFTNKQNIAAEWMRAKCQNDTINPATFKIYLGGK